MCSENTDMHPTDICLLQSLVWVKENASVYFHIHVNISDLFCIKSI